MVSRDRRSSDPSPRNVVVEGAGRTGQQGDGTRCFGRLPCPNALSWIYFSRSTRGTLACCHSRRSARDPGTRHRSFRGRDPRPGRADRGTRYRRQAGHPIRRLPQSRHRTRSAGGTPHWPLKRQLGRRSRGLPGDKKTWPDRGPDPRVSILGSISILTLGGHLHSRAMARPVQRCAVGSLTKAFGSSSVAAGQRT